MFPPSGFSSPARSPSRVLFPEPEGPCMARNSPFSTAKDTSLTTLSCPKVLLRFFTIMLLPLFIFHNLHGFQPVHLPGTDKRSYNADNYSYTQRHQHIHRSQPDRQEVGLDNVGIFRIGEQEV